MRGQEHAAQPYISYLCDRQCRPPALQGQESAWGLRRDCSKTDAGCSSSAEAEPREVPTLKSSTTQAKVQADWQAICCRAHVQTPQQGVYIVDIPTAPQAGLFRM